MSVLINISGCGGGSEGPNSLYHNLKNIVDKSDLQIHNFDTIPNVYHDNISKLTDLAKKYISEKKSIILCGYSMGGSIVLATASNILKNKLNPYMKGVILLNSETAYLSAYLKELKDLKVVSISGSKDCFYEDSQQVFTEYDIPNITMEGYDHGFSLVEGYEKQMVNKLSITLTSNINKHFDIPIKKPNKSSRCIIL